MTGVTPDRPSIEAEIKAMLDEYEHASELAWSRESYRIRQRAAREALRSRFLEQQRDAEAWRRFKGWWLAEDFPQTASDIGQPEGTPQK